MDKFIRTSILVWFLGASVASSQTPTTHYVEVHNTKIREQPKHWAKAVADAVYGDSLAELSRDESWIRIRTQAGVEGFIHQSAVTRNQVVLKGAGANIPSNVSGSDVVLAGKGFNEDIEKQYENRDTQLNYEAVDRMEKFALKEGELLKFIKAGGLNAE